MPPSDRNESHIMNVPSPLSDVKPPIHLIDTESEALCDLALRIERDHPQTAKLLLDEIERAETHAAADLPADTVTMNAHVTFVDETNGAERTVQLVYPGDADFENGKLSILTPVGAGLIGLPAGATIAWPDRDGHYRNLRIVNVAPQNH